MTGVPRQLRRILRAYDPEPAEMTGAVMFIAMGVALLGPGALFGTSPGYALLAYLLPEPVWGAILLSTGLIRLVVIARGIRQERLIVGFTSLMVFLFTAGAIGSQVPFGFGSATFGTMALASFWVCFRLTRMRV